MPRVIIPAREAEIFVPVGGQEVAVLRLAEEYAQQHGLFFEKYFKNNGSRPFGTARVRVAPTTVIAFHVMGPRGTVYMSSPAQTDEAVWIPHWDGLIALIRERLGPGVRIGPRVMGGFQPSAGPDGRR